MFGHADERVGYEASVSLLKCLPDHLLRDIHQEVRSKYLETHDFFLSLIDDHPLVLRSICHDAFQQLAAEPKEVVFNDGDSCHRMIFVDFGRFHYDFARMAPTEVPAEGTDLVASRPMPFRSFLRRYAQVSEVALWAIWENTGTLEAETGSVLLALDAQDMAKIMSFSDSAVAAAAEYAAAFVATANHVGCTDLGTRRTITEVLDALDFPYTSEGFFVTPDTSPAHASPVMRARSIVSNHSDQSGLHEDVARLGEVQLL